MWYEPAEGPNLVLVGGVEGDLGHLLVLVPHGFDGAAGQLNALQKGRLRGVAGHLSLKDGQRFLTSLEHSAVAESGDACQRHPRCGAFVEGRAWRRKNLYCPVTRAETIPLEVTRSLKIIEAKRLRIV